MKEKISRYHDYNTFLRLVSELAARLEVRPEWLLKIFEKESNFNPNAVNPVSGATGLIQFLPSSAIGLGTTVSALKAGGTPFQLEYVEKYFRQFFKHGQAPKNGFDLYLYVFRPAWVGQPDSVRLPSSAYAGNKGLDLEGKGFVTKSDLRRYYEGGFSEKLPLAAIPVALLFIGMFFLVR